MRLPRQGVRGSLGNGWAASRGCVLDSVLEQSTGCSRCSGGLGMERIDMLDLVYVLGVIAVFALIGAAARGVAKL